MAPVLVVEPYHDVCGRVARIIDVIYIARVVLFDERLYMVADIEMSAFGFSGCL